MRSAVRSATQHSKSKKSDGAIETNKCVTGELFLSCPQTHGPARRKTLRPMNEYCWGKELPKNRARLVQNHKLEIRPRVAIHRTLLQHTRTQHGLQVPQGTQITQHTGATAARSFTGAVMRSTVSSSELRGWATHFRLELLLASERLLCSSKEPVAPSSAHISSYSPQPPRRAP